MKNTFLKSAVILLIGGLITKILAMIIKICLTRSIGDEGISLYMLILPTFNLFITLSTLSLTTGTSKIISEGKKRSKNIILTMLPLTLFYNLILMLVVIILAHPISTILLKNESTYYPLMAISLTLPFICLSNLLRGYFFGKENMLPQVLSNILEQIVRLILTIYFIPNLLKYSLTIAITGVVLINIISELSSVILLIIFMPKTNISLNDFKPNKKIIKDVLDISLPTTSSRLIGSLAYFFEPIIITYTLLNVGYSSQYITLEYGVVNGYVYPLLLLPSFFSTAVSNALLPVISNAYSKGNIKRAKQKNKEAVLICLLIGIPISILFMTFPTFFLKAIFNTNLGANYIILASPLFIFHYIQSPLTITLGAINKAKVAMRGTLYGCIIKLILLALLCYLKLGMWSLIIASSINIIFVTFHHLYYTHKYLK